MRKGAFRRWMYRGQRPNWLARALNRVDVALSSLGVASDYGLAALEVTGRASGRTISLPVAIVVVDERRYLVSMLGENVQWVKNVRAAGGRAVIRSRGREEVHLAGVPIDQRAPILKVYLRQAPGARSHIPVRLDAPLADFERIAAAYPVFRLDPPGPDGAERAGQSQPVGPEPGNGGGQPGSGGGTSLRAGYDPDPE